MYIKGYHKAKSSFLSMDKDTSSFVEMMLGNKQLCKMLYYTTRDALSKDDLTNEQVVGLIGNNIKIVPKIEVDSDVLAYIIISYDNFTPNTTNPQFRDCTVTFDIICHYDQWQLQDFQLRPYRIAAELDLMFNEKHFSGIGTLNFLGANQLLLSSEFGGISLAYSAVHGADDIVGTPNPADEATFKQEFDEKPVRN